MQRAGRKSLESRKKRHLPGENAWKAGRSGICREKKLGKQEEAAFAGRKSLESRKKRHLPDENTKEERTGSGLVLFFIL